MELDSKIFNHPFLETFSEILVKLLLYLIEIHQNFVLKLKLIHFLSDSNWSIRYPGQHNIYIHPLQVGGTKILRPTPYSPYYNRHYLPHLHHCRLFFSEG